jgi:hypothetical protein
MVLGALGRPAGRPERSRPMSGPIFLAAFITLTLALIVLAWPRH